MSLLAPYYKHKIMSKHKISEIHISYSPNIPAGKMLHITSSQSCYDIFMACWNLDTIQYEERFAVMYLNRANRVLGIHQHSIGGTAGTIVDIKQIIGIALKCNASAFILCHNHCSGTLKPSAYDRDFTLKFREAAKLMGLVLLDHLIITLDGYYSFGDEGVL